MTRAIFVDSFAWLAAINKSDNYHEVALRVFEDLLGKQAKLFTTDYVIIETINALSKVEFRKAVVESASKEARLPWATLRCRCEKLGRLEGRKRGNSI